MKRRVFGGSPDRAAAGHIGSADDAALAAARHYRWLDRALTATLAYLFVVAIGARLVVDAGVAWPVVLIVCAVPVLVMFVLIASRVARFEGVTRREVAARGFRRSKDERP